jgi:hypothetical protein
VAGTVSRVDGDASLTRKGAAPRPVKPGDQVNEGDLLVTGKTSEVHLEMQDSGFIALRPNTRFAVEAYKAEGGDDDKAIFKLLIGGFRSISGWIGKYNPRDYQVRTPTATIGIRGTDHEPRYIPEGSSEGEPGTYDKVYSGETTVQTAAGMASVTPNQAGFVPNKGRERPRVLGAVPGFFRPGPHEAEINQKHAQIQQAIVQRREERRQVIRQMRGRLQAASAAAMSQLQQNKEANQQRHQEAQQMRQDNQTKRQELQANERSAEAMEHDVAARRQALRDNASASRPRQVMRERRAIREEAQEANQLRQQTEEERKALKQDSAAATQQRQQDFQQQHQAMQQQFADVKAQRQALVQEKQDAASEIKSLRTQEQARYRAELRADRRRGAASAPAPAASQASP